LWHVYKSESSKFPPVVRRAYGNKELKPVKSLSPRRTSQVLLTLLILCGLQLPALATIRNVKTNCGATGNGSTDDTAAINTCIGQLVNGDTLEFPAGTYKVSSQLTINVSGVTIDGSSNTATIFGTASGGEIMVIGNGAFLGSYGTAVALSATANELSTSFTTVSSVGVNAGDYVYVSQGGEDSSTGSGNTACDTSGCRGEILQVKAVSGNTITVTTALHSIPLTVSPFRTSRSTDRAPRITDCSC
jgi:hypothetical protein